MDNITEKIAELKRKMHETADLYNQKLQEANALKEEILRLDGAVRELNNLEEKEK